MAESLVCSLGAENHFDGHSDPKPANGSSSSLVQRRIDFHPARKPFKGFSNGGGDFRLETLNPAAGSDQRGLGSEQGQSVLSVKKRDGSEFLENGLDPELSFGITFRRIGAGLQNLGNTCFLNSVLQCLTYTEPLAAYLQRSKHQTSCRIAGFCALCAIQKHVSIALKSTGGILVPNDLVKNLQCISRNFRKARQEDAHEYMVNLLESMHKCGLPSGVPSESPSAYEKSLVHKIFGGRLRSQVKCLQCSHCSNTFDPFLDLSLEIVKADSLQKALLNFTAAEQLDGGERQYQCQRCKQKVRALKQLTIHKAPYVLTIHLKRFHSHDPGQKIMKKVRFGPTLDLKSFVSGSYEGDLKYTLYGVLVHYGGSTRSGHYYCFVRTSNGIWHSLDDNRVAPVKEEKVFEQQAYMLFYVRDRKSTVPRKPLNDVVKKEHMKANAIGNRTSSTFNQGVKEAVQNGTVENQLNGATSATAVTKKEAPNVGQSMAPLMREASVQKNNGLVVTEFLVPKKGPVSEPFSKAPLSKNPLEGLPVMKTNLVECLPLSAPSANGNGDAPNLEDVMVATAGGKITDCNENGSSKKYLSGATSPNFSDHPSSSTVKLVTDETCRKNNHVSHVGPPGDLTGKKLNETDLVSSPEQPSCKKSQVECIPNVGNSLGEADDRGQSFVLDESVKLSTIKTNGLHIEALGSKRQRKLKKKLLKCQVARMQLRSNFFLRASLSLRKKKKQKRSKSRILDVKNVSKELLDKDCVSSDMRPSTSESTRTTSLGLTHPQRKGTKSGSKKAVNSIAVKDVINSNGDCLMDDKIDGEFRVRINESSTVLATDKKLEKSSSSSSVPNQWEAKQLDCPKDGNREVMQNGLMSMLTRGLEKTVVARWDGIELPPSEITESNGAESVSIGYIPDEWDEEYDRGKRKKVRESKPVFGGPNPFQEIATKKPQMKKAKVDRYSSGNQPFRI